ncbi:hypothetical protein KM043_004843 [Ampulex compressa]|nr:hypothetical protein KM043_004843 [Ampulex compressa]
MAEGGRPVSGRAPASRLNLSYAESQARAAQRSYRLMLGNNSWRIIEATIFGSNTGCIAHGALSGKGARTKNQKPPPLPRDTGAASSTHSVFPVLLFCGPFPRILPSFPTRMARRDESRGDSLGGIGASWMILVAIRRVPVRPESPIKGYACTARRSSGIEKRTRGKPASTRRGSIRLVISAGGTVNLPRRYSPLTERPYLHLPSSRKDPRNFCRIFCART